MAQSACVCVASFLTGDKLEQPGAIKGVPQRKNAKEQNVVQTHTQRVMKNLNQSGKDCEDNFFFKYLYNYAKRDILIDEKKCNINWHFRNLVE